MRPKVGIGILVLNQDEILLGKRKNAYGEGTWGFPGGHLEFGETATTCAERELLEETNLKALKLSPGPWVEVIEDGHHFITIFVSVSSFTSQLINTEPDKIEDWQWFSIDALPTPLFIPITKIATGQSLVSFLEKNSLIVV